MPEWLIGVFILFGMIAFFVGAGLFVLWVILKMVKNIFFRQEDATLREAKVLRKVCVNCIFTEVFMHFSGFT